MRVSASSNITLTMEFSHLLILKPIATATTQNIPLAGSVQSIWMGLRREISRPLPNGPEQTCSISLTAGHNMRVLLFGLKPSTTQLGFSTTSQTETPGSAPTNYGQGCILMTTSLRGLTFLVALFMSLMPHSKMERTFPNGPPALVLAFSLVSLMFTPLKSH